MRGPRKVRVFRDPKKSPNWYVEWRDEEGRRHCESCGPDEVDAKERARQVRAELDRKRGGLTGDTTDGSVVMLNSAEANPSVAATDPVLQLQVIVRGGRFEFPLDLSIEVGPEAIRMIGEMVAAKVRASS